MAKLSTTRQLLYFRLNFLETCGCFKFTCSVSAHELSGTKHKMSMIRVCFH